MPFDILNSTPEQAGAYVRASCDEMNIFERRLDPGCREIDVNPFLENTPGITGPLGPVSAGSTNPIMKAIKDFNASPFGNPMGAILGDVDAKVKGAQSKGFLGLGIEGYIMNGSLIVLGLVLIIGGFMLWSASARAGVGDGISAALNDLKGE